ncbi:hypothetical protein [Spiroplasma floricola]|uniref:Uncharacterized protein n=1 Tax=Spiroplasma floricola 23-6 TaxID=1336749 RepID=A0A2K8SD53_9MOLU|nr:hypothetical protein [Spiroplasma floricola]AUB31255.1 hypothetical protein SFLOR_v1c01940 [Spiroplasma floricola 23-6]
MTRNPMIPENTNKRKFIIWQQLNLTNINLSIWIIFIGLGAILGFFLWKLEGVWKLIDILFASLYLISDFLLNTKSQFHNKKFYAVIFDWF